MKCPICDIEMKEGSVQVRGNLLTFLSVGWSMQNLIFDCDDDHHCIVGSREKRKAFYCPECSGTFIQDITGKAMDPDTGVVTEIFE